MKILKSSDAFKLLNGIFCIYKPAEFDIPRILESIKRSLIKDLHALESRSVQYYDKPVNVEHPVTGNVVTIGHVKSTDYSRHPLVLGPVYEEADIEIMPVQEMDYVSSGLCLMAINDGCDYISKLRKARRINVYHITGRLGRATLDFMEHGKIIEKTTFNSVTSEKIDKTGSRIVAKYRKLMFEHAGVNLQTQEAYELAKKGLFRPKEDSVMIVYALKCIHFQKPYFTIELHAINESFELLKHFINDFGLKLKSTACCSKIRKVREGNFTLQYALLYKHWTLENILNNIQQCRAVLKSDYSKNISQTLGKDRVKNILNDPKSKYTETLPYDLEADPDESYELDEQNTEFWQTKSLEHVETTKRQPSVPLSPHEDDYY